MKDYMNWWREGKFGMFIHFGLYSATEGFWNGEEVPFIGEWIQYRRQIPVTRYRSLTEKLNLDGFDAKQYVRLAKDAGMTYLVFGAKHHEGFAMYDSKVSDYNITKLCKDHRDPLKEISWECQRQGIRLGIYYSHSLDWEDPDGTGNTWDYPEEKKDFSRYFYHKCFGQVRELLTNYGEISVIWFDMPQGDLTHEQSQELYQLVKSLQPNCICSGRLFRRDGCSDYNSAGDNVVPYCRLKGDNETAATHNNTWGYKRNDVVFKPASELCRILTELVSKNTNYLLNIGPRGDGSIPEPSIRELTEAGKWVHANAEAIYGTKASPYDFEIPSCRFTRRDRDLYLFTLESRKTLRFNGLLSRVREARFLDGRPIQWQQQADTVTLDFGSEEPALTVVKLSCEEEIRVRPGLYPDAEGVIHVPAGAGTVCFGRGGQSGPLARVESIELAAAEEMTISPEGVVTGWSSTANTVTFSVEAEEGDYQVKLLTQAQKYQPWIGGHVVRLESEESAVEAELTPREPSPFLNWARDGRIDISGVRYQNDLVDGPNKRYYDDRETPLGTLHLTRGTHLLTLRALKINRDCPNGLAVLGLRLIPG